MLSFLVNYLIAVFYSGNIALHHTDLWQIQALLSRMQLQWEVKTTKTQDGKCKRLRQEYYYLFRLIFT
jgi:hypothetical protein